MCAKITSTLKMKSPLHFTAMCPGCFELFNIDIPKAKIEFEYEAYNPTETINTDSSVLTDPYMYCRGLHLKHNCGAVQHLEDNGQSPYLEWIDSAISKAVQKFNNLGFHTTFSCEGHIYESGAISQPYILFDIPESYANREKYLKPLRKAIVKAFINESVSNHVTDLAEGELPWGWKCEFDQDVADHRLLLSSDFNKATARYADYYRNAFMLFTTRVEKVADELDFILR